MVSFGQNGHQNLLNAYDTAVREELESSLNFQDEITTAEALESRALSGKLSQVSYVFTTWGMMPAAESDIRRFAPKLEAVFYAAGSVQSFARPFLQSGVKVFSAFRANAVPVAEYTLAQIILSAKGYFQAERIYKQDKDPAKAAAYSKSHKGNYGLNVGLLGAGAIGRLVIEFMKPFNMNIFVFDPFLSDETAAELGVRKTDLDTIFAECDIVSNHLANNINTKGILHYGHFSRLKPYTTFINTGRGAQVVEADLALAMQEDSTRTAVLDVTWPEPLADDSPFYELENVFNTPHIAGSQAAEIARMGEYMLEAWKGYESSEKSQHEVTLDMLDSMA